MSKAQRKRLADDALAKANVARTKQVREILEGLNTYNIIFFDNLQFLPDTINALLTQEKSADKKLQLTIAEFRNSLTNEQNNSFFNINEDNLVSIKLSASELKTLVSLCQARLLDRYHNPAKASLRMHKNKETLSKLESRLQDKDPNTFESLGYTAFLIKNFRLAEKAKGDILDIVLPNVFKNTEAAKRTEKLISKNIERGHGVGVGISVSLVSGAELVSKQLANLEGDALKKAQEGLEKYIKDYLTTVELEVGEADSDIKTLAFRYNDIVGTNNKVDVLYVPYITFQDYYSNKGADSLREKRVLQAIRAWAIGIDAKEFATMEGSPPLIDRMIHVATAPILEIETTSKNFRKIKTKISKRYKIPKSQLKAKGTVEATNNRTQQSKVDHRKAIKPPKYLKAPAPTRSRSLAQQGFNQLQLVGILNASLPPVVRKNMQYPALQNRTGLFSESVKVTSIDQTPKGFPSISYTYDKIPYQVFEMGIGKSPWATPERDPRKLIDKSVRELAAEYMTQRFYTKRV